MERSCTLVDSHYVSGAGNARCGRRASAAWGVALVIMKPCSEQYLSGRENAQKLFRVEDYLRFVVDLVKFRVSIALLIGVLQLQSCC